MKSAIDEPRGYLERLKPQYVKLFRTAHAIMGNDELAEYVLRNAIVEAYLRRNEWRDRMGFSEGLLHTVREVALFELRGVRKAGDFELDWVFPAFVPPEESAQALLSRVLKEGDTIARMALLAHGAGLSAKQVGCALNLPAAEVSAKLGRLNAKLARVLPKGVRRGALEDALETLMGRALATPGEDVAEMGAVFRSFERDVYGLKKPKPRISRVLGVALRMLFAAFLAAVFWLIAVLVEPSRDNSARQTPTVQAESAQKSS